MCDLPEAIWSNLGLTYLAHTHVPTIWTKKNVTIEPHEWVRGKNGELSSNRRLPNGIVFAAQVVPAAAAVHMTLRLTNGTDAPLSNLRVQQCVMLKGAREFARQTNENKVFAPPYAACRSDDGRHWVITAWTPNEPHLGQPRLSLFALRPDVSRLPAGRNTGRPRLAVVLRGKRHPGRAAPESTRPAGRMPNRRPDQNERATVFGSEST